MRDRCGQFADGGDLRRSRQSPLSAPQILFHILTVVDVDQQAVPTSHHAFSVMDRLTEHMEPPVGAIGPAHAVLNVMPLAGFNRMKPRTYRWLNVVRVEKVEPASLCQRFECCAELVKYSL